MFHNHAQNRNTIAIAIAIAIAISTILEFHEWGKHTKTQQQIYCTQSLHIQRVENSMNCFETIESFWHKHFMRIFNDSHGECFSFQ